MEEYRVQLPRYHGPLDLLLYLVKKNEIDICDIPIGVITDQFQKYLEVLKLIDVEIVGDFLVTAATLAEIKSRMILPQIDVAPLNDVADPRGELVQQLLEYRRYKEAATQLETQGIQHERRLPRGEIRSSIDESKHPAIRPVELWDLVSAFARIVREAETLAPEQILTDDTPQQVYQEIVLTRVRMASPINFDDLFDRPYHRLRLIGLFLALLELIRSGDVCLDQVAPDAPIQLCFVARNQGDSKEVPND